MKPLRRQTVRIPVWLLVLVVAAGTAGTGFSLIETAHLTTLAGARPAPTIPYPTVADGWVSSGYWRIGRDVQPGTYTTTVPAGPGWCVWNRPAGHGTPTSGQARPGDTATITIQPGDYAVLVEAACGWWRKIPTPPGPESPLPHDEWIKSEFWWVGNNVRPGRWQATVPVGPDNICVWHRYVNGGQQTVGYGRPGQVVTLVLKPGDTWLVDDCGWWRYLGPDTPTSPPATPQPSRSSS